MLWSPHYGRNDLSEMIAITNKRPALFIYLCSFLAYATSLIERRFKMTSGIAEEK